MSNAAPVRTWSAPPGRPLLATILFTFLAFLPAAVGCALHSEPESHVWISAFFVVPLVLQAFGLVKLREDTTSAFWWLNYWATLFCQGVYCVLWAMYSSRWKTSEALSYVALVSTIGVLVFVTIMTFAVMRVPPRKRSKGRKADSPRAVGTQGQQATQPQPSGADPDGEEQPLGRWEEFSRHLSDGVGRHPFWAITFFMSLFLGVSYLFGFALAFHDKHTLATPGNDASPALYMANLPSADERGGGTAAGGQGQPGGGGKTDGGQGSGSAATQADESPSASQEREEYCFYFDPAKAKMGLSEPACRPDAPNPQRAEMRSQLKSFNSCSLNAIVRKLKEELDKSHRVKVTLLGHADNETFKGPDLSKAPDLSPVRYLSNYELSEARAQYVQYEILWRLRGSLDKLSSLEKIQWAVFPAADEPMSQINHNAIQFAASNDAELQNFTQNEKREDYVSIIDRKLPPQDKRVVLATIDSIKETPAPVPNAEVEKDIAERQGQALGEISSFRKEYDRQNKPKPLKLMDYMYFSIYTITTTGYGDIVPTTAYAKFVTSVANIFEVIFLVVFFNAILSLKGSPDSDSEGGEDVKRGTLGEKETPDERGQGNSRAESPVRAVPRAS